MATYKHNGKMLWTDDTLLWRQMVNKEKFLREQQNGYKDSGMHGHSRSFGGSKYNPINRYGKALAATAKDNLA